MANRRTDHRAGLNKVLPTLPPSAPSRLPDPTHRAHYMPYPAQPQGRWDMSDVPNSRFILTTPESVISTKRKPTKRLWQRLDQVWTDTWFPELTSWSFSLLCLAAAFIILAIHDGRPLPNWPYQITLNTLVSLFVTLATTLLMVPVSGGLSQLKWIWFVGRERKISDLKVFDDASRGAWGSIQLIFSSKARGISSLGATVTILVLAANTITQQAITYESKLVPDSAKDSAISLRSTNFTASDYLTSEGQDFTADYTDMSTEGAIYSGLLSGRQTLHSLRPSCSTGNCTWPSYTTLGVCAALADVTDQLTVTCNDHGSSYIRDDTCWAKLPNRPSLKWRPFVYDALLLQPSNLDNKELLPRDAPPLSFANLKHDSLVNFFVIWTNGTYNGGPTSQAVEVNLHYCIQTLQTNVTRGHAITVVKDAYTEFRSERLKAAWTAIFPKTGEKFSIGERSYYALQRSLSSQFNGTFTEDATGEGINSGYSTPGMQAIWNAVWKQPGSMGGIEILAQNLATSLTNHIRSSGSNLSAAVGRAYFLETFVRVSWPWITAVACIEFASLIFLLAVMYLNRQQGCQLWKTSPLALARAVDEYARPLDFAGLKSNWAMQEEAKMTKFKMIEGNNGWKLRSSSVKP